MILLRGGGSISTSSLVKTLRKYSLNVRDIFFRILCCFFFLIHFAVVLCVLEKRSEKTGMLGSKFLCFTVMYDLFW